MRDGNNSCNEKSQSEKIFEKWVRLVLICIFIFVIIIIAFYLYRAFSHQIFLKPGNNDDLGEFGDFFGGVLNPILTFASVILLIISIRIQITESRITSNHNLLSISLPRIENLFTQSHKSLEELMSAPIKNTNGYVINDLLDNKNEMSDDLQLTESKHIEPHLVLIALNLKKQIDVLEHLYRLGAIYWMYESELNRALNVTKKITAWLESSSFDLEIHNAFCTYKHRLTALINP